jgi:hypothetical protein
MSLSREDAARTLGMKAREVTHVEETAAGPVVTTHDGVRTLIHPDGRLERVTAALPAAPAAGEKPCPTCQGRGSVPDEDQAPAGDEQADVVPQGGVADVLAWVNKDPTTRAPRALQAERNRPKGARTTLVADLQRLVGHQPEQPPDAGEEPKSGEQPSGGSAD